MDKKSIKKSLKNSILDGTFYSMMVGLGESFFMAFGVFLKADVFQQGLLGSLPQSLGYFLELFSDRILRIVKSRKTMVLFGAILQGLMYIPVMLVFLFSETKLWWLIFFVSLYWILGMVVSPAWNSWMADLVPVNERGRYFGKRTKIAGIASFISFIIGGLILEKFAGEHQHIGYIVIFTFALISRMISVLFLFKQEEPKYIVPKERYKFREFIKSLFHSNFGVFTLYMFLLNFAVQVSAPFFVPYMLNNLKMSYITMTLVTATSMIVKFMVMPAWGKLIDKYGSRSVLKLTGYMIPFVPLMWVFNSNFYYLLIAQVLSGFVWAGFELATVNFMFDATPYDKRAAMIAYFNVLYGISIILGSLFGSYVATLNLFLSGYLLVFFTSSMLRLIIPLFFINKIAETRKVPNVGYDKLLFKILEIRPTRGFTINIVPIPRRKHKK